MSMNRLALIGVLCLGMLAVPGTAQVDEPDNVSPGLITPSSMLYGVERFVDAIALHFGLISAGSLANERASEAYVMYEQEKTGTLDSATASMQVIAQEATENDIDQLESAAAKLDYIRLHDPDERGYGGVEMPMRDLQYAITALEPPEESSQDGNQSDTGQQDIEIGAEVRIRNSSFQRSRVTVAPGEHVRVVNEDVYQHTVTNDRLIIDKPVGSKESTTLSFRQAGTYEIYCRYHDGMSFTIAVTE